MNAERLLAHFERISEAPDSIARLRRFILDLAVRGKLVEQDPEDEPVSLLLDEIKSRMTRLRLNHAFSVIDQSEIPFDEPSGWTWCRLGEVCEKTGSGSTPRGGKDVYKNSGVPFLRSQNIYDDGLRLEDVAFIDDLTHERMAGTRVLPCDLLLNITGGSIGRCAKVPLDFGEANISQHVAIIRVAARGMEEFLHSLILSPYFQEFVDKSQTGAGRGGLPKNRMDAIPIPLPPLAEQHRIVAKVDELMACCDQLEAALQQREQGRERLVAAALQRLNQPSEDPASYRNDASFAMEVLPSLTTTPAQIKQLRQTILNLAVRGKLVAGSMGQIAVIGDYRNLQNGYAFKSGWFAKSGIKLLRNANVGHGQIRWKDVAHIPEERFSEFARFSLEEGDIVLTLDRPFIVTGTKVARVNACDLLALLLQRVGRFIEIAPGLDDDYLFLWINSPHFNEQIDPGRSNGVPHISSKQVEAASILIPPLAEQHRIVAKVDELMALCDQLEQQLSQADQQRRRLLEAGWRRRW